MKKKQISECNDKNCPFHGNLKTKKKHFVGTVISNKMQKNVTIMFERVIKVPKYERYDKKRTKIKVHNPPCINAKEGELVKAVECRPLSKTVNFVIVKKFGKGDVYHTRDEDLIEEKKDKEKRFDKEEHKKKEEIKSEDK